MESKPIEINKMVWSIVCCKRGLRGVACKGYDPAFQEIAILSVMNLKKSSYETWRPESPEDCGAIRIELEQVLASQQFCNSKRYPALLRFVVESALAGRADELKERTLGIEVFQRPPNYDTNADTVVRYTAGEVRKRLSLYYHEHEPSSGVQISLPAGSYVPEFHREIPDADSEDRGGLVPEAARPVVRVRTVIASNLSAPNAPPVPAQSTITPVTAEVKRLRPAIWLGVAVLCALLAGLGWRFGVHRTTPLDQFWAPMLHGQKTALLCSGGNVFADNHFSGTETAGKDIDYPFVSMQIASGISHVSGLLERAGLAYEVQAAASTPLTEMRERPIVLFGGYNNLWTLRLLSPLRFHFAEKPGQGIVDRDHLDAMLLRDQSRGYGNADDYALVARFRDTTTGSMVVVLAGLGRNGTEAASQFVTNPDSMRLLQEKVGGKLADANIEVVLKASVIGGRTGAPSIQNVYVW